MPTQIEWTKASEGKYVCEHGSLEWDESERLYWFFGDDGVERGAWLTLAVAQVALDGILNENRRLSPKNEKIAARS